MHIGKHIFDVVTRKNVKPDKLAALIHCERTNIYRIYQREYLNTELLSCLSLALNHNFFRDLADELQGLLHEDSEEQEQCCVNKK